MTAHPPPRKPGRPKGTLPEPAHALTARIRKLIDVAHAGNLTNASRLTGLSYPTLRDLYLGANTTPGLGTLESLRAPYGLELPWFLGEGDGDRIPLLGRKGLLPPAPSEAQRSRTLREVLIPFEAWLMYCTFVDVERELIKLGPGRQRPIVAEASGDAFVFRLTSFLMQPLLSAEKLGVAGVIIPSAGTPVDRSSVQHRRWIDRLDGLGRMWRSLLPWVGGD